MADPHPPDRSPQVKSIASVLPVPDLPTAVRFWSEVLGTEPTFVDGDRWAQFDVAGTRIALAGTDRMSDRPGLMLKVECLTAVERTLEERGVEVSPREQGPHEERILVTAPGELPIVLYEPRV
jgi:extradiol dioxygenase family protein